jgi:DNA-binding XRE family transcriptional regulator
MPRSSNSLVALPPEPAQVLRLLGQRLRACRLADNMTVGQAAERLLCSPTTYRNLEAGRPTVSLGMLVHALWLFGALNSMDGVCPLDMAVRGHGRRQRARPVAPGIGDDERNF